MAKWNGEAPHADAGLQPERTVMSWGRTVLAFIVASLLYLRWMPHYGWPVFALVAIALLVALGIFGSQGIRYERGAHGIRNDALNTDAVAVFVVAGSAMALGIVGVLVVLFLPLR